MQRIILSFAALCAAAHRHSWLDCADWDTANDVCRGFPRDWHSRPSNPFGADVGRDQPLPAAGGIAAGLACQPTGDSLEGRYSQQYPMAVVGRGQEVTWRWPAKNHASTPNAGNLEIFIEDRRRGR